MVDGFGRPSLDDVDAGVREHLWLEWRCLGQIDHMRQLELLGDPFPELAPVVVLGEAIWADECERGYCPDIALLQE